MPWYPMNVAVGIREIAASAPDYQCEHFDAAISASYKIIEQLKLDGCDTFFNEQASIIEDSVSDARVGIVDLREKFVDLMHYADKEEDRADDLANACDDFQKEIEDLKDENRELRAKIEKLEEQLAELTN